MLCAEPSSSPVFKQRYLVAKEAPPAAIAGVHERTAVIDRVRALALIVVYNSMAHTKRSSYARPARESANIRTGKLVHVAVHGRDEVDEPECGEGPCFAR
jgi:hypothetical protein